MTKTIPDNRKRTRWPWPTGALVLSVVLALMACGRDAHSPKAAPLTAAERAWLKAHPVIRLAPDPDFPPVEYFDKEGAYGGMTADYVALIEKELGIRLRIVRLRNWDEIIAKTKSGQIDVIVASATPQRAKYLLFTRPFLELPAVIIARERIKDTLTLDTLSGMKVSVVSGYAPHDFIADKHPKTHLDPVPDVRTGLRKVSFGLSDAFVENLATTSHYIEKEGIANLRIAGDSGYVYRMGFCSRRDWPELNRILEKGVAGIGTGEKTEIHNRWIPVEPRTPFSSKKFQTGIMVSFAAIVAIAAAIVAWNRSLARRVRLRTGELEKELAERRQVEEKLRFTQFAVDNTTDQAFWMTEDGRLFYVNDAACRTLGYSREELIGMSVPDIDLNHFPEQLARHWHELKERGAVTMESCHRAKDGRTYPVEIRANHVILDDREYNCAFVTDISERKRAEESLRRLNRELLAMGSCNKILMRAEDEQTLLNDICRTICNEAGYRMAWVGYAERDDAKSVRPVAWAGVEEGYLADAGITWGDTERGQGPTGTAIRSGKCVCIQDFSTDSQAAPWREPALKRGYRSNIALPLKDETGQTFGALTIYSTEPDTFVTAEMRLIEDLAGDLAFGIRVLRNRTERRRMREELERARDELERRVEERTAELRTANDLLEVEIAVRQRNEGVIMARLRLLQFAGTHSLDDLLEATLDEAEALTGSLIGFYHFLESDQKTLTLQNWSTRTKREYCRADGKGGHGDLSRAGVWTDCIQQRRPVIHNDYASLPHRRGLPPGHTPLTRELVVPVFRGDSIVAVLGVGNKLVEYTSQDVETVSLLANLAWEITEHKRLEEELLLFHFCINKADIGIYHTTPEGDILSVNEYACRSLGYREKELLALKVTDIDPVITSEKMREIKGELERSGSVTHESLHRRRDGTTFPVEIVTNSLEYRGITYSFSFVKDISERKRAEGALRDANLVVENSPVVLFRWRDDDEWPVELVSQNVVQFGYGPEEFLSGALTYSAIIHPHDRERVTQEVHDSCHAEADQFSLEYRIMTRGGDVRWVNEHSNIERSETGGVRYFEGIVFDVTERKLAEEELVRQKRLLQELNDTLEKRVEEEVRKSREKDIVLIQQNRQAALGEMLDHIAHQWKQPLNAISLIVQEMACASADGDLTDGEVQATIAKVVSLLEHMSQTIDVFRGFFRPDKEKKVFNLKESIDQAIAFIAPAFRFQGIAVEPDIDPALTALGYPKEYAQALLNILANARDVFRARKTKEPRVLLRGFAEGERAVVTITDNAGGIPEAVKERIFDFYFTTNEAAGGTGIGLYMSRNIIERNMGGRLSAENVDSGARFRIEIPLA